MCTHIGSIEAVRSLIHLYVRFEFLRIDTQLQLNKLGDRALAGLIESTRHPAPSISEWARRRLDFLGKAIPSEVVQVQDAEILADVLRAYGRTRDPDAPRLIISFANSERAQVRLAARQAVNLLGEIANWPLRDTYENMVGKKPPRDWTWERTARELFRNFDQIRLAELYEHYQLGLTALEKGDLEAMRQAFDKVLARDPQFEPREKLAEGYLRYALQHYEDAPEATRQAAGRAARIALSAEQQNKAKSLLLTLEAKRLSEERRIADQSLLRQALELDPQNPHAVALQAELSREPLSESPTFMRVFWPALLGVGALLSVVILVVKRRFVARA
jgi:tetratricopeptide (TPR) repeat protein